MAIMAVRVSSPVLIGRSVELGVLRAAAGSEGGPRRRAVVVGGEAGVGKSRLIADFSEWAVADGVLVLTGGCIDLGEGGLPYGPIIEALRGFIRSVPEDEVERVMGPARADLARLIPDLGPSTGESPSGLDLGSAQGRLFELLLATLGRLAARRPVAFVVEDLHWADRSTRDLLGFLVRNIADLPVTLILTFRSDELHRRHPLLPFLAELERTGHVERIELHTFDRAETAAQVRAIAGPSVDAGLIDTIHLRSGGNPFFAEELLVSATGDAATQLPRTLREVLLARIAGLGEPTQEFLRLASAAGRRVDPTLVAAATGMDESSLYEALREAVTQQVLVPDALPGKERYAFRHALLQEAVYEDLLPGERTRLHSAFGRILEASGGQEPGRVAELAYHWLAAHDLPRALGAAVAAGREAERSYAFPEAHAHYAQAIALWDQVPDAAGQTGADLVDVLAAAARAATLDEPARAMAHLRTALELVDAEQEPTRAGLLYERLGRSAWFAGQADVSLEAHRTAVRLIPVEPPTEARARALAGLAQILMLRVEYDESRQLAEEAIALARLTGARQIEGHALNTRGVDRNLAGDVESAIADLEEAMSLAVEVGNVDDIGRAYGNLVFVLENAGRLDHALRVAREGLAAAGPLGVMRSFGTHLLCNAADLLYRLGQWDEAEASVRQAVDIGPLGINEILANELLGRLAVVRGRLAEATEHLGRLRPLAERAADVQFVLPVHLSLTELALWQGRAAEAAETAEGGLRLMRQGLQAQIGELIAMAVRAYADVAEKDRARRSGAVDSGPIGAGQRLLEAHRARHARAAVELPAFVPESAVWLALSEAEMTRLEGRPEPAMWAHVAEQAGELSRPYVAAYGRWREAEAVLAQRGDRARASTALVAAARAASALRAGPLRDEIRALALRARIALDEGETAPSAPPVPDDGDGFGLTRREREVLALVALGRTNRQIADELFISEKTAGVHVSNILGKLGVSGRGEAAAVAHRLRLADAQPAETAVPLPEA